MNENAVQVFDPIAAEFAALEQRNEAAVFAYDTPAGNKAARSHIFALRQVKGRVDKAHKTAKAAALEVYRVLDAKKRELTERLDAMIEKHDAPLRAIEEAAARAAVEKAAAEEAEKRAAEEARLAEIARREKELADREAEVARQRAELEAKERAQQAREDAERRRQKAEKAAEEARQRRDEEAAAEAKRAAERAEASAAETMRALHPYYCNDVAAREIVDAIRAGTIPHLTFTP